MPMNEKVVFSRAIHALRLPDGQLPIVLSALEARPNRFIVEALREIAIRMYETHRAGGDSTEVYTAEANQPDNAVATYHATDGDWWEDGDWYEKEGDWNRDEEVSEIILEDGSIVMVKPKKARNPRNTPGAHEASRRGAVKNFSNIPNRKGKGRGQMLCLRCGDPSRTWKDCPNPYRKELDPRFGGKGKGEGETFHLDDLIPESPANAACASGTTPSSTTPAEVVPIPAPAPQSTDSSTQPGHQASINDVWAQYYAQDDSPAPALINVCHEIHFNIPIDVKKNPPEQHGQKTTRVPPPILIDGGASCSVVGEQWLLSWGNHLTLPPRKHSGREFRFGDGPPFRSLGEIRIPITIQKERSSDQTSHTLTFCVDVVSAIVPMLISQQALTNMQGRIDFSRFTLEIPHLCTIKLTKSSTGHVLLPGVLTQHGLNQTPPRPSQVFPLQQTARESRNLTDEEIIKIHRQLGHCSEKQLVELLKFGGRRISPKQIQRVMKKCNCQRSVRRITPPVVSRWIARFSGEVVAIDTIYPFSDVGADGFFPLWKKIRERSLRY